MRSHEAKPDKQTIFKVHEPAKLMEFLMARMPGKGRNSIKAMLKHRQVSVNYDVVTHFEHPLLPGQQVIISKTKVQATVRHKGFKIVYEDPYLIVIDKQPGLLSIATDKEREATAYSILMSKVRELNPEERIFVVHRLDRDTSGLMMFAKSWDVKQKLQQNWDDAIEDRCYVAVVEGQLEKDEGTLTSWLKQNKALKVYSSRTDQQGGQKAVTHYRVLKRGADCCLLELHLETGRKNQIRVQLSDLGHCVVGDRKYGAAKSPIGRMALHARSLAFTHPVTGAPLRFETPIPGSFTRLLSGKSSND